MVNLTFNIENRGAEPLEIYGLNIAGLDADQFTVLSPSVPFTVGIAGEETVTVRFDGTSLGQKQAELLIASNDADESTCVVKLQGVGTSDAPNLVVKHEGVVKECGSGLVEIDVVYGSTTTFDIVLENTGTTSLTVSNISFIHGDVFDVFAAPTLPFNVPVGQTTTITVEFDPSNIGIYEDAIVFATNDLDDAACSIDLRGEGLAPESDAELVVSYGANTLVCGESEVTVFADQNLTGTATITISNSGTEDLILSSAILQGADSQYFTLVSPTANQFPFAIAPSFSSELDIQIDFNPISAGNRVADLIINSNDSDENPCIIKIKGNVTDDVDTSEIVIIDENNLVRECGYTLDFGDINALDISAKTIYVENIGATNLTISSLVLSGVSANAYTIVSPTAFPIVLSSNTRQQIDLEFSGSVVGVYDAVLTINNSDVDESACVVNLKGSIATPREPEIQLVDDTPTNQACGVTIDFGTVELGDVNPSVTYTIKNLGLAPLTVRSLHFSGAGATAFSLVSPPSVPFDLEELSGEQDVEILYNPTTTGFGTHNAVLHINNTDDDEDPCNILLIGEYVDPSAGGSPELQIFDGATEYQCGDTYDMGETSVNVVLEDRIFIKNGGTGNLIVSAVNVTGDVSETEGISANIADTLPIYIPENSSTYLNLTLLASTIGTYSIDVELTNNDSDENPCVLTVVGEVVAGGGVPDIQIENEDRDEVYPCGSTIVMSSVAEGTNANVNEFLYVVNVGDAVLTFDQLPYFTGNDSSRFTWEWVDQSTEDFKGVVRFNPSGVGQGVYTSTLNIESNDPDEDPCTLVFEITVEGLSVVILDEDFNEVDCAETTAPGYTLDVGIISLTNTNTETYYIKNNGTLPVTINSIAFVNTPTEFTLSPLIPPTVTLQPNEMLSAGVTLEPQTLGIKTNQIKITTTDPALPICTLNVTAEVLDLAVQDLEVINSGVVIECGGIIDFGEVEVNAVGRQTIELSNVGEALLTVSDLMLSGGDASLFAIPLDVTPIVIPEAFSETAVITFDPQGNALGQYSTTLQIISDDPDETPCNITLVATVVDNDPEVNFPVWCGSTYPVSKPVLNSTDPAQSDVIEIENVGNGDWIITEINITGDPEHTFIFNPSAFPIVIPTNSSFTITVNFDTPNIGFGAYTTNIEIVSNAPDDDTCDLTFNHVKIDETLVPELDLEFQGNPISCGDSIVLPQFTADILSKEYSLSLINSGTRALTISGIAFDEPEFSLDNPNTPFDIDAESQLDLTMFFTHTGQGTYTTFLEIQSDDDDENPCIIFFSVVVGAEAQPDIELQDGNNVNIACGSTIDFGVFNLGEENNAVTSLLKIFNVGEAVLTINGVAITGANASAFGISNIAPPVNINVGSNAIPILNFNAHTSGVGVYNAVLTIQSNDPDEEPCILNLTAEVVQPNDSEISLVIDATTLDTPVNCGDLIVLDPAFDNDPLQGELIGISNTGTTDLILTDVTLTGANAASFTLSPLGTPLTITPAQAAVIHAITIDPAVVGAGTYTCSVNYISNDPNNPVCTLNFTVTIGTPVVQDIQVYDENLNPVACGSYTLDFGDVDLNATSTLTIRVENAGTEVLDITDIDVLALAGGVFTEVEGAQVLAAGAFIDIDITFDPTSTGVSTGQLRIFSDDPDEATCTVNLQGTGTAVPELQLQNLNGSDVDCGTFVLNLGTTEVGTSTSTSFIIRNVGSSDLTISNMTTTNAEFTTNPNSFPIVIAAGGLQSVVVTYDPAATGVDSDTLTITSDDSDEGTCNIALNGEGIVTAVPDIQIKDGATPYACGALTKNIGQVEQGDSNTTTFIIENTGTGNLNVTNITSNNGDFTVAPTLFSVPPSGTQTIVVTYTPTSIGSESATVTITSDDPDEATCTVTVDAQGIAAIPDIQLQNNNTAQNIPCGSGTHTFNSINVGQTAQYILEIDNDGLGTLNISSITSNNGAFTVSPSSMSISSGNEQDLTITWSPIAQGYQSATITINSNDPDEDPCTFFVEGTAIGSPEIQLLNMSNGDVVCGIYTLSWIGLSSGDSVQQQFQIKNTGSANLVVNNITTSNPAWTVNTTSSTIAPTNSIVITVTYNAGNTGNFTGTLNIFSNDSNENPCVVNLNSTVEGPEIQLQNNSTAQNYACNAETFNLGIVGIGNSAQYILEIDNDGQQTLNISSITSTGSGNFSVSPSNLSIAPGSEQDITITFTPTSLGTKNATFTINSNDYDEAACSFNVTGIGSGAAEIQLENHLGADIACGTGTVVNFGNVSNGATTPFTMAIENIGNSNLIVSNITLTGANANAFDLVGGTNYTINAGSKQNITIEVTPDFVGQHTAVLTVTSNDSDESTCAVTLQFNVAANPELQLLDSGASERSCGSTLFTFSDVLVGDTESGTFSIRNEGTTDLSITSINSSNARVTVSGDIPTTISPNSTKTYTVTYAPNAVATHNATITIVNDDADEGNCTFQVNANGVTPLIQIRDENGTITPCGAYIHDFGGVDVGDVGTTDITVENIGTAPLTLTNVFTSSGGVTTNPSNEPITIPVGGVLPVTISFAPLNLVNGDVGVGFSNDGLVNSACAVRVVGVGLLADLRVEDLDNVGTELVCGSNGVVFGNRVMSDSIDRTLVLYNDGNKTLEITNISSTNPVFVVNPADTTKTIGPGQFDSVQFSVVTSEIASHFGQLVIQSNDYYKGTCNVNLSINTIADQILGVFDVDASQTIDCGDTINFGNRTVSVPLNKNLNIINAAPAGITYSAVISGSNAADFSFSPTGGGSISGSSSSSAIVTFTPSSAGAKSATLTLKANHDLGFPECIIPLSGTGI